MDTKVNYALVGTFVIGLIAAIVLAIIWLSSGLSVHEFSMYQINMEEAVTGLSPDATVEYNGVNVGSVKSIKLDKKDPQLVKLIISVHDNTPITLGTVATLGTRGLTGITYISLKDKGDDLRPLKKLSEQDYPVIKTAPSLLLQLNTGLQKLTESISQVSNSFKALFDKQNLQSIKEILINLQQISATLAANNERLNNILANTSTATQRFPQMMQTLETNTLPQTNQLIANLNTITDNLSNLSAELQENPSMLIRGKKPQTLGPGEK